MAILQKTTTLKNQFPYHRTLNEGPMVKKGRSLISIPPAIVGSFSQRPYYSRI